MNAQELKQYIIDNNQIQSILEALECEKIKEYEKEYRCALPDGHNPTQVAISKSTLSVRIYTHDGTESGDIFTLVMKINDFSFDKSVKFIHSKLNLPYTHQTKYSKSKSDPLAIFHKVRRHKYNVAEIPVFDEIAIRDFLPYSHIDWIREGISPAVCDRFGIGYSPYSKRIVIPWRYWSGDDNSYVGVVGRTIIPEYKELGIPKYYTMQPFEKSKNIYGLNENYADILKAGYVVVFESEKSVLKRASRGDNTGTAIGCCEISEIQASILISLNVEVILCFDEGISLEHIRKECEKFYGIRKVSYIYDTDNLIESGSKNSPADMDNDTYITLLNNRKQYKKL